MPGGDRTGPAGAGARTGRGRGYCSGSETAGWTKSPGWGGRFTRGWGAGMGFGGGGRGRRWRHWARATGLPGWVRFGPAPADEAEMLQAEADQLQNQLDAINQRLSELDQER